MIVISFDLGGLLRLKQQIPSVRIMPLFGLGSLPDDPVKLIRDTRSCGLDVQEAAVTEALARELRKAGYLLNVWTVNKTASLARLAQWRADYLTTDTLFLAPSPNPLPERPEEFEALRDRRSIPLSGIKWRYAEAGN